MVHVGGRAVSTDTRKAIALLAYLAITARPSRRDALAVQLWPDSDRERAGAALRRTLSALRKAVGPERLTVERATVGLTPQAYELDVARAAEHVAECATHGHAVDGACQRCAAPLAEAAALHRGPFLEGFALRDSAVFDDWQFFTGEELRRSLAAILERLAQAHALAGDLESAIGAARRWLGLDPLHEPAHRALMRLYADAGQHAAAVRQYRECVLTLERELGVQPLEETSAVYRDVMGRRLSPPEARSPAPGAPPPVRKARPFVGRAEEIETLVTAIQAITQDGILLAVEGEAGIGKTRLVGEALADPRLAGRATVIARCYEGETGLAYGLLVDALRALVEVDPALVDRVDRHLLAEVARLLPELVTRKPEIPPASPLDDPGAPSRFVDGLGRFLIAGLAGSPANVLVCEDLHWADEASLDVLMHLVRRLQGRPLAVIVTWRTERVPRGDRLRRLLADMHRDERAGAVLLERLGRDAVAEIVALSAPGSAALADRIYAETEGLPLLVVEYAAALVADGRALDHPISGDARDVLLARLDGVSAPGAQVLATAAVIGRSFDLDTVRDASGRSDEETVAAVEELVRHGIVAEVTTGTFDFSHTQLRALAYAEAGLTRQRLLHRRVALALAARARRTKQEGPYASAVAAHFRQAGEDAQAAVWAARAGEHAAKLLALTEAAAHYSDALALGHRDPARISEALGDLATRMGAYPQALARYEAAAALAGPDRAAVCEHKLGGVYARQGDWVLADLHYEAALAALNALQQQGLAARLLADRSLAAHRRGDPDSADELAQAAMEVARAADDREALAQAHNLLGILASSRGEADVARSQLTRSLDLARGLDDPGAEIAAANNLALACAAVGDIRGALDIAYEAVKRSAVWGDRHREAALHNNLADLNRLAGHDEEAMAHLKQAVALFAEVGEPGVLDPEIWKLVEW